MNKNIEIVLNNLNAEWANDMMIAKSKIAILTEENIRLKQENEVLKKGREKLDSNGENAK